MGWVRTVAPATMEPAGAAAEKMGPDVPVLRKIELLDTGADWISWGWGVACWGEGREGVAVELRGDGGGM